MKKLFTFFFLFFYFSHEVFAALEMVSLLPNPSGDDTLGEYIEVRNTSCTGVDISGYSLSDASGKTYIIPLTTTIDPHTMRKFPYSETKISLNNSGIETVYLKDSASQIIDSYTYSGTQKDDITLDISYTDENCENTSSGTEIFVDTGVISSSGSTVIDTGTGGGFTDNSSGSQLSTSFTGEINTQSGELSQTGGIDFSSGSILSSSGTNSMSGTTGEISDIFTNSGAEMPTSSSGVVVTSSGSIDAEWLSYDDEDGNGFIDTLFVSYNEMLTGSVNIGSISLYSRSGGLFTSKIETATGYVLSGFLSGNIFILKIREGDIPKTILKINNTTSSDLRLKSAAELGFTSQSGKVPTPFFLTTSFLSYKNVSPKKIGEGLLSGSGIENTGTSTPGDFSGEIQSETITFPKIFFTLQSPTNALYDSGAFLCTKIDCLINITLAPIFSSGIIMRDYQCYFGTGENLLVEDSDCNPNTYILHESGSIFVELFHKKSLTRVREVFPIYFRITPVSQMNLLSKNSLLDSGKPVAVLEIDTKWKEYYEQIGDYEMNCYAYTCSLNFTAEKSYDPEGNSIRFLWIYGLNEIKSTKDPGALKYSLGDHRMILRVIDGAGNFDEIIYTTHVLGPRIKTQSEKIKNVSTKKILKNISAEVTKSKKKYKKIRMEFFSLPIISLQGKTGKKIKTDTIQCIIKTAKTCSLNFSLSGVLSSLEYRWYLDGKEVFRGKNPKAWKFRPGKHILTVETYRKGATLASSKQSMNISVVVAPKKPKKTPKKPKTKKSASTAIKIIPTAQATNGTVADGENSSFLALFILLSGLGFGFLLRGRKKGNHSS